MGPTASTLHVTQIQRMKSSHICTACITTYVALQSCAPVPCRWLAGTGDLMTYYLQIQIGRVSPACAYALSVSGSRLEDAYQGVRVDMLPTSKSGKTPFINRQLPSSASSLRNTAPLLPDLVVELVFYGLCRCNRSVVSGAIQRYRRQGERRKEDP